MDTFQAQCSFLFVVDFALSKCFPSRRRLCCYLSTSHLSSYVLSKFPLMRDVLIITTVRFFTSFCSVTPSLPLYRNTTLI